MNKKQIFTVYDVEDGKEHSAVTLEAYDSEDAACEYCQHKFDSDPNNYTAEADYILGVIDSNNVETIFKTRGESIVNFYARKARGNEC